MFRSRRTTIIEYFVGLLIFGSCCCDLLAIASRIYGVFLITSDAVARIADLFSVMRTSTAITDHDSSRKVTGTAMLVPRATNTKTVRVLVIAFETWT